MAIDFARGAAAQIGTTIFRKVAGDLNGVISGNSGDTSSPDAAVARTKFTTKNLSFPLDIGEDAGGGYDVLSPGIDRRRSYYPNRTFTLGVNIKF